MHIGFVPFYTDSFNDVLWVEDTMRYLLKYLRLNGPKLPNGVDRCDKCRFEALVEYHHVRPLWSVAAQVVLDMHPVSHKDLGNIMRDIAYGDFNRLAKGVPGQIVRLWGAHDHIIPLCPKCHNEETKICNAVWKAKLSEKFALLWSYRSDQSDLSKVAKEWYGEVWHS